MDLGEFAWSEDPKGTPHVNVVHTECGLNWGGQEYRTLLEHRWLRKNGHESWLLCAAESELYRRATREGDAHVVALSFRRPGRLDVAWRLWRFCRRRRIQIIHCHGSRDASLALLSHIAGVPVIRSRHVTNRIKRGRSYRFGSSHVIASAEAIERLLRGAGVPADRISVVGEGVDLSEYRPDGDSRALRKALGISPETRVVMNVGMLRPDKGQQHLIEATHALVQRRHDVTVVIVGAGTGDGEHERALRGRVDALGLGGRCILTGYRDDVPDLLRLADFVVITSTGTEAQSRIVPQAFATRRTVVATNVGGLTERVRDRETGLVVPPSDVPALITAIEELLDDDALRDRLAANAYAMAQQELGFDRMMERTLDVYRACSRRS